MPKRCRHVRTVGTGRTGAPCPIEMAATDSMPPGLEFGSGEDRKTPELKTSQKQRVIRVYNGRIEVLPL